MPSITLRFVAERNLGSWLIRTYSGALPFSHVGAITVLGTCELGARWRKDGAKKAGVQYRPIGYRNFSREERVEVPCTEKQETQFWSALQEQIGKPYSWSIIAGFFVGHDFETRRSFDCSSLMAYGLAKAGLLPPEMVKLDRQISPPVLYAFALGLRMGR
jgi:hypothetical protein